MTTLSLQGDIVNTLLERVHMEAALSLEPLLALLGALARDLQTDFLPFVPRIFATLGQLVDQGKTPTLPLTSAYHNHDFPLKAAPVAPCKHPHG